MTVVVNMSQVKKITQMGMIKVRTAKSLKNQNHRPTIRMRVGNQSMNLLAARILMNLHAARSLMNHALPKDHLSNPRSRAMIRAAIMKVQMRTKAKVRNHHRIIVIMSLKKVIM